jgi:hypothetical protein
MKGMSFEEKEAFKREQKKKEYEKREERRLKEKKAREKKEKAERKKKMQGPSLSICDWIRFVTASVVFFIASLGFLVQFFHTYI